MLLSLTREKRHDRYSVRREFEVRMKNVDRSEEEIR